jgi:GT2 family glycosyltransferase
MKLVISIVDYHTPGHVLGRTLASLDVSAARAVAAGVVESVSLDLIDNSADRTRADWLRERFASAAGRGMRLGRVFSGHGNIGYGAGHNLSILESHSDFHLIANPDLDVDVDCLANAVGYLTANPAAGLLSPQVRDEGGVIERRLYRYPSVLCLGLRGFAPPWLQRIFVRHLDDYTFGGVDLARPQKGIPIVTGCFMLFRTATLKTLRGFDEKFFLYFEDFDLSLRAGRVSEIHYCPDVVAVHFGGNASRKGFRHIRMFAGSAARFFNKHGWKII